MRLLWNILAVMGLFAVIAMGVMFAHVFNATREFDPNAFGLYKEFMGQLLETGDMADAFVWEVPVDEGIEVEDVIESMKSLATARNFLFVGESPFYKQVEAVTGEAHRYVAFFNFCDARVGAQMIDYNDAYTAFMPCNIALVEGKDGRLTLYSMNMDFMIHGARELPPELKASALKVRKTMRDIMEGAAAGEF